MHANNFNEDIEAIWYSFNDSATSAASFSPISYASTAGEYQYLSAFPFEPVKPLEEKKKYQHQLDLLDKI